MVSVFAEKCYFCGMETKGRKELMYKEVGKYCLDLSKLVFGGVILAGVMDLGFDLIPLILVGLGFVFVFGAMGMFAIFMANTK